MFVCEHKVLSSILSIHLSRSIPPLSLLALSIWEKLCSSRRVIIFFVFVSDRCNTRVRFYAVLRVLLLSSVTDSLLPHWSLSIWLSPFFFAMCFFATGPNFLHSHKIGWVCACPKNQARLPTCLPTQLRRRLPCGIDAALLVFKQCVHAGATSRPTTETRQALYTHNSCSFSCSCFPFPFALPEADFLSSDTPSAQTGKISNWQGRS